MSLTYSQKQYIQKYYPDKSIDELARDLNISHHKVQKHIDKNAHFFAKKEHISHEEHTVRAKSFGEWIKNNWMNLGVLTVLVIIVYINAFTAEFVSDDIQTIQEKGELFKSSKYFMENPSFFARSFLYYIAYALGGLNPFFYRIFNIIFHIGAVWTVYALVPFFSKKQYLPFIVASLVAVHPMMIESVTWISGGIYVQAAFFTLLAFLLYLLNSEKPNTKYTLFSLLSYLLALSVSEKIIVFPAILLLYEYCYGNLSKNWTRSLPYWALSFGKVLLMLQQLSARINYLQTTNGTGDTVHVYNPFTQIPVALGTYLKLYIWPRHLTLYHSDFYRNTFELITIFVLALFFIVSSVFLFFKNKKLFFWLGFFVLAISPTLNPFGLSWVVAERYIYFASLGIFFLAGYAIHKLIDNKKYNTLGFMIFVILLVSFSIRTLVRNHDWRNVDNLWIATGKASPSDPKTHNNLGDMYARHGNMEMAIKEFSRAIELNPGYSAAYYNIGNTYKHMKNEEMAYKYFMKSLEINPTIWQAYMNIAIYHFERGNIDEAEKYVAEGLKYDPNNPGLYANLGVIYYTKGNKELARMNLQKALQIDPKNQFALGWVQKISQE